MLQSKLTSVASFLLLLLLWLLVRLPPSLWLIFRQCVRPTLSVSIAALSFVSTSRTSSWRRNSRLRRQRHVRTLPRALDWYRPRPATLSYADSWCWGERSSTPQLYHVNFWEAGLLQLRRSARLDKRAVTRPIADKNLRSLCLDSNSHFSLSSLTLSSSLLLSENQSIFPKLSVSIDK